MAHELSSTTLNILNILNDSKLHTGTEIAETLGVSRTAIWKVIQRLKRYNIDLKSRHQGYLLNAPLFLLDKGKIETFLKGSKIKLEIFESISSTNDFLKNKPLSPHLSICLAEHQTRGRGRMGRSWTSPFGRNIHCSFSYVFNRDISEISGLSLVIGILIAKTLESFDQRLKPLLKWPNDIYMNNKKIGGILIDLMAEANGSCRAIIGIGLNINMKDQALEDVNKPWTSLENLLNAKIDRNILVAQIIDSVLNGVDVFLEKGMDPFLSEWSHYDLLKGKKVSVTDTNHTTSGIARGITQQGYLLLELPSGEIKKFSYGDATLLEL
jgi:BirA family biotin operon repressor/biotin-[acetyl-CoA-carboxylase] ligase